MLYRFSLFASSLLATFPLTTLAQTVAPAAPQAITIMTGPVGNAGNGAAATSVAAAPGVSSVTMGLGAGAGTGVGGTTGVAPASPANTAGVIGNGQVAVWVVKVGGPNNELVFSPNSVTAKVGEMVQFQFYSRVSSLPNEAMIC
jgi:hypothetical protein